MGSTADPIAGHASRGSNVGRAGEPAWLPRAIERTYGSLLRATEEGFCVIEAILDADGRPSDYRFLEVNDAFERQTGLADVRGRTVRQLLPALEGRWLERVGQIARSGRPERWEDEIAELARWFDVYAWRIGRPRDGLVAVSFRDITERKLAEERLRASNDTFRRLVEDSPFGVYVVDADFRLAMVSAGAEKVFVNVRPLIGRAFDEVMRVIWPEPAASEFIGRFRHTLASGEAYRSPSTVEQRADIGETEAYDWKIERIVTPDGRLGVVCHFYDWSERKQAEATLQKALAARDEFLGFISHELRTPMTVILGMSRVLVRKLDGAEARDVAIDIATSAEELNDLIDSLLVLARVEGEQEHSSGSPSHLGRVIEHVLDRQRERDPGREYLYHRADAVGPVVGGEEGWLERVLVNLVGNAGKYSPPGQPVSVILEDDEDEVRVMVLDGGIGLQPDEIEHLFEPFFRGSPRDERVPGAGLGLAVCKRIIESMGGRIWARSRETGGAEFGFAVPSLRLDPEPGTAPDARGAPGGPAHDVQRAIAGRG
jgi:PAS domain S-box-containing protein